LTCALAASSGIAQAVPLRLMGPTSVFTFVVSDNTDNIWRDVVDSLDRRCIFCFLFFFY
jgi:hypothetical protein